MIPFIDLGTIDYSEAHSIQMEWVKRVQDGESRGVVLFCTHPPVVTLGRSTQSGDVRGWMGDTVEISRGGRATYHGPGQLVIYPIINLMDPVFDVKERDLHAYLRLLEDVIVESVGALGVEAESRSTTQYDADGKELSFTGVWAGEKKLASIGIGVKKWVTFHGAAINVWPDPKAFLGINPCGFSTETMTCMEEVSGASVSRDHLIQKMTEAFSQSFSKNSKPKESTQELNS